VTDDVEVLHGGVANAGAVLRVGDEVLRPANAHSPTIHRFLRHVAARGAAVASEPIAITDDGRERLRFVPGDVPVPPYPAWAQSETALVSTTRLIRRLHDASVGFAASSTDTWSGEMADFAPGREVVICHNDVCLENVVFRDTVSVALLDFDFAAPGRRGHDLGCFVRMCVPVDDEVNRATLGWEVDDLPGRVRLVADTYGCSAADRADILDSLDHAIRNGGEFVRRHAEAGEPGFVAMWEAMGGMERFDRRRGWWARERDSFVTALA
jgi:hypothetical protein